MATRHYTKLIAFNYIIESEKKKKGELDNRQEQIIYAPNPPPLYCNI